MAEESMGMSFMMLLILGGAVILFMAIVGGVLAMAMSGSSKDRDRDDRR
jgi:fucose permease